MSSSVANGVAFGATIPKGESSDEQMEQIRDLLLGDIKARLGRMEARMEALEARLAALSGEIEGDRRMAFETLARGVQDLGEHIKRIAKP